MREVGVLEAKTNLSALLDEVERGNETVVITRHGRPVARLTAFSAVRERPLRRFTGAELAERFERTRDMIDREYPELNELSQEDWKRMGRE